MRTLPIFVFIDRHSFEIRHSVILSKFQWDGKDRYLSSRCHNVHCKPGYVIRLTSWVVIDSARPVLNSSEKWDLVSIYMRGIVRRLEINTFVLLEENLHKNSTVW